MNEPQTASELMMQNQMPKQPLCALPNKTVQTFLLELIDQSNFPGRMAEFVGDVKSLLRDAALPDA
jgi:hypothetical protein